METVRVEWENLKPHMCVAQNKSRQQQFSQNRQIRNIRAESIQHNINEECLDIYMSASFFSRRKKNHIRLNDLSMTNDVRLAKTLKFLVSGPVSVISIPL